tara:strand:- start:164 stop:343 length:180 start_codon:yes stop_codon:yes gene_type:complete
MNLSYKKLEKKCEDLQLEIEQLKQDFYFDIRNKQMEIEVLKNRLREVTNENKKNNKQSK